VDRYIEVPFLEGGRDLDGWDCYGLCWYVAAEAFGRALPTYSGRYTTPLDYRELRRLVDSERTTSWRDIPLGSEQPGDVMVLRTRGLPIHVGLVIGEGRILHCERSVGTVVERYTGLMWARRILGVHRYGD